MNEKLELPRPFLNDVVSRLHGDNTNASAKVIELIVRRNGLGKESLSARFSLVGTYSTEIEPRETDWRT